MSSEVEKSLSKNVIVCKHPFVSHNLTALREKSTPPEIFRAATRRLATALFFEATKNLPLDTISVETPLEVTDSQVISEGYKIILAPILRAALIFSSVAEDLIPTATTYHIGLYRDEETLKPVSYYNKIPKNGENYDKTLVFVLDPMLATGGSAVAAVQIFKDLGIPENNISFISLISSPEGISKFISHHPLAQIYTCAIDRELNEKGYILPGLGDAGDRTFNTFDK